MLIPVLSNLNREKNAEKCRTRVLDLIANGLEHPPPASFELGRTHVVKYLDRYRFMERSAGDQQAMLESLVHPTVLDASRDRFLRTCCGLERPVYQNGPPQPSCAPSAPPPVLLRAEELKVRAEARVIMALDKAQNTFRSASSPADYKHVQQECLSAAGQAHFAFSTHSQNWKNVLETITPMFGEQ